MKVPVSYESEMADGFHAKVEFLGEYWEIGTYMQFRVTIKNDTESDIVYDFTRSRKAAITGGDEGKTGMMPYCLSVNDDLNPTVSGTSVPCRIHAGETVTYEGLFAINGEYFDLNHEYSFFIRLTEYTDKAPEDAVVYRIDIPIEVVDLSAE